MGIGNRIKGIYRRVKKKVSGAIHKYIAKPKSIKQRRQENVFRAEKKRGMSVRSNKKTAIKKALKKSIFGFSKTTGIKGTGKEKKSKVLKLEKDITKQKEKLVEGDTREFLRKRTDIIQENRKEIERIKKEGTLEKPQTIISGHVPFGIGGIGGAGESARMIYKGRGVLMKGAKAAKFAGKAVPVMVINQKNAGLLKKILVGLGLSMTAVMVLKDYVSTRIFAGFIEEESLQGIDFSIKTASKNNDLKKWEEAIKLRKEILYGAKELSDKIPWLEAKNKLEKFRKVLELKNEIDERALAERKLQIEKGETDEEMWKRLYEEKAERERLQREENEKYYKRIREEARRAKKEQRKEDEKYWYKIFKEKVEREKRERDVQMKYWEEYKKRWYKLKEELSPSKLNFGLI